MRRVPSYLALSLAQAAGTTDVSLQNNGILDVGVSAVVPGYGALSMVNRILPSGEIFTLNSNVPVIETVA